MNFTALFSRTLFINLAMGMGLLFSMSGHAAPTNSVIAYVANAGNNNVQLLDVGSGETLNKLYTGAGPWRLVKSPDGKKLIVQNWYSETSAVVDLATNSVDAILPVRGPSVYDPKGKLLWSQSWPATQLQAFDAKTYKSAKQRDSEDRMVYDLAFWDGFLIKGQYDPLSKVGRRVFDSVLTLKLDDPKAFASATKSGTSPARLVVDPTGEFLLTANHDDRDISMPECVAAGWRRCYFWPASRCRCASWLKWRTRRRHPNHAHSVISTK